MLSMLSGLVGGRSGSAANDTNQNRLAVGKAEGFVQPQRSDIDECIRVITTSESPDEVVSAVRRLAEVIVYAEQRHMQPILDAFFERDVVRILRALVLRKDTPVEVQVQCLQTFSILAQSLRDDVNLFQFLSQDHVNLLIEHPFDFANAPEELLAHYISLLKTVALRLDATFCQFFYNVNSRPDVFPLYDKAVAHFANPEPLVRASVRSVILMVHHVDDNNVDAYVAKRIDFFEEMCNFIRQRYINLRELVESEEFTSNWLSKVDAGLSDVLDDFSFLQDILSMREQRNSAFEAFLEVFHRQVIDPLLTSPSDYLQLLVLAQCCLAVKNLITLKRIYDGTLGTSLTCEGGDTKTLYEINLDHDDDRIVLATATLAFFFVDQIDGDESFISRKKRLTLSKGLPEESTLGISQTEDQDRSADDNGNTQSAAETPEISASVQEESKTDNNETNVTGSESTSVEDAPSTPLIRALTQQLLTRTAVDGIVPRPVIIRILCKLLVHLCFDSRLLDSVSPMLASADALALQHAMASSAESLLTILDGPMGETVDMIEAFEDEWRELKAGSLKVSALVTNPSSVVRSVPPPPSTPITPNPEQERMDKLLALLVSKVPLAYRQPADSEEIVRALANTYMVLRLSRVSLERMNDLYFPSVGNAEVDSITEGAAFDLRKCEFLETRVWLAFKNQYSEKLLMVIVADALLLIAPDNELRATGVCRSVAPIHRIEIRADPKDPAIVHLAVRSARRIGLASKASATSKNEYLLTLQFDGEPKAGFAQEQIKRAASRSRNVKLKRIRDMLEDSRALVSDE